MFYLWPIDRCSNSRTSLCWQSARSGIFCVYCRRCSLILIFFHLGSHVIPTLELIGVGGLLPRMIFHRLEPMFDYPREMGFPYIYIYCISISRVFWRFLTIFGFYRFFVHYSHVFWRFLTDRFHLSDIAIFKFCPIWEMGSIFRFFNVFLSF